MKTWLRLIALTIVAVMAISALTVFADDGFVSSVESYTAAPVVKRASTSGNSEEDVVADLVDADGKVVDVQRKDLDIVNPSDTETSDNKEALEGISKTIEKVEKDGGVKKILDSEAEKVLKDSGIKAENLAVATVFDVTLDKAIPEGATLQFSIKAPAISSLQKSDEYTGKYVLLQENTETGKFEALKQGTAGALKAGEFAINGEVVDVAVSHLCVFMFAAETTATTTSSSLAWLWILLIVIAVLIVVCIVFFVLKKKKA